MNKMISEYYTVTSSSEFHEIERLREKARHDEAQILYQTAQKNRQEGFQIGRQEGKMQVKLEAAKKLKDFGIPLDQIVKVTNLTHESCKRPR